MPTFSTHSIANLETCDRRLKAIATCVIAHVDFSVICGFRGKEAQDAAYQAGTSKLAWPNSKHNYYKTRMGLEGVNNIIKSSLAFDFIPYPPDPPEKEDRARYALIAGYMLAYGAMLGYRVRWGGDWNGNGIVHDESLEDLGHFELLL